MKEARRDRVRAMLGFGLGLKALVFLVAGRYCAASEGYQLLRRRAKMTPAVCVWNPNSNRNNPCAQRAREGVGM